MEIEERTSDLLNAVQVRTEIFKFGLILTVDCEVDEEGRMCGPVYVVDYSVERSPSQTIVGLLKSVYADEHRVGRCLHGERPIGIYDHREEANSTRILNDVFDAVFPVMPEKRLAAL